MLSIGSIYKMQQSASIFHNPLNVSISSILFLLIFCISSFSTSLGKIGWSVELYSAYRQSANMFSHQLYEVQIQSSNSNPYPFELSVLDLCLRVSNCVHNLQCLVSGYLSPSFFNFTFGNFEFLAPKKAISECTHQQMGVTGKKDDGKLRREDAEMVMRKLGLFCSRGNDELDESISIAELSELFNECEPSLKELKEAFDIFDKNGDGFIDEMELQRVLWALGLMEVADLQGCKKMIRNFDENKDGTIDFKEFVKLMEATFC